MPSDYPLFDQAKPMAKKAAKKRSGTATRKNATRTPTAAQKKATSAAAKAREMSDAKLVEEFLKAKKGA